MTKVLINGLLLNQDYSGVQYSIEYFIEALGAQNSKNYHFTVLLSHNYSGSLKERTNLTLKRISFNTSGRMKRIFYENVFLPIYFRRGGFRFYHSPGYVLPLLKIPAIVTVHDIIPLDFPRFSKDETVIYYKLFLRSSLKAASGIIAVSNCVKDDIMRKFPDILASKIHVVHHGIHSKFLRVSNIETLENVRERYHLPEKYMLFLGNIEPRKNLISIFRAFDVFKNRSSIPCKLVIAGKKGWKYSEVFDFLDKTSHKDDIIFTGYVRDADIPALYSMSEVFLFPSWYEGFGMPALEAMACGCPVIISNRGALPEITGKNCLIVDPSDISELAESMTNILSNGQVRDMLIANGLKWSGQFTWALAATKTLNIYQSISRE
ncbi:glycosyltransferase family 4 protein [Pedobacter jejuensis]|uniref:Glycosyltransferase family 1 protein n=1 Tax=Pedobacter jejuensis TaxID=1268550 RepID=A0A3N0BXF2_9SPHI|nr:glycosyltransferase family 1 protein [Pedobacter jejuensis]RNL53952.1 glycosyltransferase family 1 protein [Pedobacter jejuensis]